MEPGPALSVSRDHEFQESDLHRYARVGDRKGLDLDGLAGLADPRVRPAWFREVGGPAVLDRSKRERP